MFFFSPKLLKFGIYFFRKRKIGFEYFFAFGFSFMLMLELFYAFFIWLFVIGGFIGGFLRQLEDYSELDFFLYF
jgi:hypothetical protein